MLWLECTTIGKDNKGQPKQNGKKCAFPFTYNGKVNHECTWDQAAPGSPWCSTRVDHKGVHVENLDEWGVCGEGCPIARQLELKFDINL